MSKPSVEKHDPERLDRLAAMRNLERLMKDLDIPMKRR